MTTFEHYFFIAAFSVFGGIFVVAVIQTWSIRKKSIKWSVADATVSKLQGQEGTFENSVRVKYSFDGKKYEEWASNAFNIPTGKLKVGEILPIKINPAQPIEVVLMPSD